MCQGTLIKPVITLRKRLLAVIKPPETRQQPGGEAAGGAQIDSTGASDVINNTDSVILTRG
ncbi:hypothetical protein E2C01_088274 [Portunus trituberculatus]|uniref:Uncharacterized protein n=1 Tax=Portunus trituberculatus TaxID=210409 RepID=A0A5B7JAB2_PORTR|nr:hypothetical protein [Portunus trituberculatus]